MSKPKVKNQIEEEEANAEAVVDECEDTIRACMALITQIQACPTGGPEHDAAMVELNDCMTACALTIADCAGGASDAQCVASCIACAQDCDDCEAACDALAAACPICAFCASACAEACEECDEACDGNAGIVDDVEDEPAEEEPEVENSAVGKHQPIRVIDGTMKPYEPFWHFRNAAESESGQVELEFFGPISEYTWWGDEITPGQFKKDLYSQGKGNPVTVLVNSPGGEVVAASVIRSILQEYPGNVTADIIGMAASAATIMVTGADHIRMRESALFMIHDPSALAYGTIDEIKQVLSILNTVKDSIISTYQTKTGMDPVKLAKMMRDETWMTAQEAKDFGFVDEVVKGSLKKAPKAVGVANCLKNYTNVPVDLLSSEQEPVTDEREVQSLRDYISIFKGE